MTSCDGQLTGDCIKECEQKKEKDPEVSSDSLHVEEQIYRE